MKLYMLTEEVETNSEIFGKVVDVIVNWVKTTGIKIIIALVLWFVLFKLINFINKKITKKVLNKKADKTIVKVVNYVISVGLKVLVLVCLLGYVGVETTSISAAIASVGVGVGMALNGALSNFAGGVLLFLTRPFSVDDYIEALDKEGTVEDIHIVYTKLRTTDNRTIYLPNGALSDSTIVNYSEKPQRRLDLTFTVSLDSDVKKVREVLLDICLTHPLILKEKTPFVRISNQSEKGIDFSIKVWTNNSDYWDVRYDVLEEVKERFTKENIIIPYNQLDVHIKNA